MIKKIVFLVLLGLFMSNENGNVSTLCAQKREFRGAWIQCVNGQYLGKTPAQIRQMLSEQLDVLQSAHINTIIFQVRAEGDALYKSKYEPWSRYLTGQQGLAPSDGWDPLEWMVTECHKRNMECHAWINPYRAKTKGTTALAPSHAVRRYPSRVFQYGDLMIFDPAQEINRKYTCVVIEDILTRYDVDGLHMDDYFYPYPESGCTIPDDGDADKRRQNVNLLIEDIYKLCRRVKPWVKFGISPFGIYRNNPKGVNSREGSATKGLQNYDQLYADILLWHDKGWVDYFVPQVYWNVGTAAADYKVLCQWWNDYCGNRVLVIGQDVERTVKGDQTDLKYNIQRSLTNVDGSCQWYAAAAVNNNDYLNALRQVYHPHIALQPLMPWLDDKTPDKVRKLKLKRDKSTKKFYLTWREPKLKKNGCSPVKYAVYRFEQGEKIDIESATAATHLIDVVTDTKYEMPLGQHGKIFVVTALSRLDNESEYVKKKL